MAIDSPKPSLTMTRSPRASRSPKSLWQKSSSIGPPPWHTDLSADRFTDHSSAVADAVDAAVLRSSTQTAPAPTATATALADPGVAAGHESVLHGIYLAHGVAVRVRRPHRPEPHRKAGRPASDRNRLADASRRVDATDGVVLAGGDPYASFAHRHVVRTASDSYWPSRRRRVVHRLSDSPNVKVVTQPSVRRRLGQQRSRRLGDEKRLTAGADLQTPPARRGGGSSTGGGVVTAASFRLA